MCRCKLCSMCIHEDVSMCPPHMLAVHLQYCKPKPMIQKHRTFPFTSGLVGCLAYVDTNTGHCSAASTST